MAEVTIDHLRSVLRDNTRGGEIYPSVIRLVAARDHWSVGSLMFWGSLLRSRDDAVHSGRRSAR